MTKWKYRLFAVIVSVLGLAAIVVAVSLILTDKLVNVLWFYSVEYELYFWQRVLYKYLVYAAVTAFFFVVFFVNFWVGSRYLGAAAAPQNHSSFRVHKDLYNMFRSGSMKFYGPVSFLLTIPLALPLYRQWEMFLFYLFGPNSGMQDPAYGKDISYYLFSFPIYTTLQRRLFIAFSLLFLALALLYRLEKQVLNRTEQPFPRGAKLHLSFIILVIFLIEIWGFSLQRHALLYSTDHEPLFFGPGWVQMKVVVPLIWASIALLAGMAISLVTFINVRRGQRVFALFTVLFLATLGIRYSNTLQDTLHAYVVKPNELSKLKPFIQKSIDSTLSAYRLDGVETLPFEPESQPFSVPAAEVKEIVRNIPVWDGEMLNEVYEHLQKLRTYYDFSTVDVSRFSIDDTYQQVYLAARELNLDELPPGARTWVNEHLSYTHGYGYVVTPAEHVGDEPLDWITRGIPPRTALDFEVKEPSIYYGLALPNIYSVAPNSFGEFGYPLETKNVIKDYEGKGGVPIGSPFVKILFSYYFRDKNLLFTTKTTSESRILFRRNIREMTQRITPYLLLDKDPYLAITPERLYWIQDAYTTSNWYPYAAKSSTDKGEISYIRNSVKIVVDAYNGAVDYYVFDPDDPIIQAYRRIYPGVFKDREQMPELLRAQVRYPQDYFNVQMDIYAKYHQKDPQVFYYQEDVWDFAATMPFEEAKFAWKSQKSYYLTLDLIPDEGRLDFLLLSPFTPRGRTNLRSLVVAGGDPWNYGKIMVYSFPKGQLVYGPHQVNAFINQDPNVSAQFTLWSQAGSEVRVGKMILLPIGKTMTYIQPVYLKAITPTSIPELKRLIMVQHETVVMEPSLLEGYVKLQERLEAQFDAREGRRRAALTE